MALTSKTSPSVLALARQDLPQLPGSSREKAARGAYVLLEDENAAITLVSTGSEVSCILVHECVCNLTRPRSPCA